MNSQVPCSHSRCRSLPLAHSFHLPLSHDASALQSRLWKRCFHPSGEGRILTLYMRAPPFRAIWCLCQIFVDFVVDGRLGGAVARTTVLPWCNMMLRVNSISNSILMTAALHQTENCPRLFCRFKHFLVFTLTYLVFLQTSGSYNQYCKFEQTLIVQYCSVCNNRLAKVCLKRTSNGTKRQKFMLFWNHSGLLFILTVL